MGHQQCGCHQHDINTLIASHVIDGKLALTGSFGNNEKEAQGKFEKIAAYIRNNSTVTALDFGATTGVTTIGTYQYDIVGSNYETYDCKLANSSLKSVNLPASVTTLGYRAFQNCAALTTVTGGSDAISVGEETFSGCTALTTVPTTLKTIADSAFYGCTALKEYSSTVTTTLNNTVFSDCTALTTVNCPNATSLYSRIFFNCTNLEHIYLTAVAFSTVKAFTSNFGLFTPFSGIKNPGNVTLHLNANQKSNITMTDGKPAWSPKNADGGAPADLVQTVDLSGFKAVYCGTEKVYSTAQ